MTTTTTSNPYRDNWQKYKAAGWGRPVPIPHGHKHPPPNGWTGRGNPIPSFADNHAWETDQPQNIAIVADPTIIGIDVDAYGTKKGADALDVLCQVAGDLPATWMTTSRDDGVSGIRWYRIPEGFEAKGVIGNGVEIVQNHHRYAVAPPSLHPEGGTYLWWDEATGHTTIDPPNVDDLPHLPDTWLNFIRATTTPGSHTDLDPDHARTILHDMPGGEPCRHQYQAATRALHPGSRHDNYTAATLAIIGNGRRGCPGTTTILTRLRDTFIAETAHGPNARQTHAEAHHEWERNVHGALELIATQPQEHGCPADLDTWLTEQLGKTINPDTDPSSSNRDDETHDLIELEARDRLHDLLVNERARELHTALKHTQRPTPQPVNLAHYLNQPDSDTPYRIDQLWPANGRLLIVAQAKAGKTTLNVNNIIPALTGNPWPFLGKYDTQPVTRHITYLNLEVSDNTFRRWLRRANIPNPHQVNLLNLRGLAHALNLSTTTGRQQLAHILRDLNTETLILDPLAPLLAAHSLDENSNTDVATFWAWWNETLTEAGVIDDIVIHHAGHHGDRSRGASRLLDEPDAIWTLTLDTSDDDETGNRYLSARGRDVHLDKHLLNYNPDTGIITLQESARTRHRNTAAQRWIAGLLEHMRELPDRSMGYRTAYRYGGAKHDQVQMHRDEIHKAVLDGRLIGLAKPGEPGVYIEVRLP